MMSLNNASLLVLSLVTTLMLFGCGEEPSDDINSTSGDAGVQKGDSDSSPGQEVDTSPTNSAPISPLSLLVGKKYIVDFDANYWIKPGGDPGKELGGYTPKFAFEFKTVDDTTGAFTALLGTTKNGVQNVCNKTYTLNGTLDSSTGATTFTTTAQDISEIIDGPDVSVLATLRGFTLSGEFYDQGAAYKSGGIMAELDGREIYSLFTLMDPVPANADVLCDNLYNLGVDCEACTLDANVVRCLTVEARLFKIQEAVALTLQEVAATDTSCI